MRHGRELLPARAEDVQPRRRRTRRARGPDGEHRGRTHEGRVRLPVRRHPAAAAMKHYALLVESIEASVAHLQETAALEFRSPARIPFVVSGHDETYDHEVRACYTVDKTVELVEAADRGPFAGAHRFGLHH